MMNKSMLISFLRWPTCSVVIHDTDGDEQEKNAKYGFIDK